MTDETQDAVAGGNSGGQQRTPPYISFRTLVTFIEDQKQHGLPSDIDRSVLTKFSGSTAGQLLAALKFLELIDDNQAVQPGLQTLVDVHETKEWPNALTAIIRQAYGPLVTEDLARMTPAKFHEVFKSHYSAKDAVLRKCEVFFLKASEAAGIEVNPRIIKHRATRPASSQAGRTTPKAKKTSKDDGARSGDGKPDETEVPQSPQTSYEMLIGILDPTAMEDDEQQAVWTLIRYLRKRETEG